MCHFGEDIPNKKFDITWLALEYHLQCILCENQELYTTELLVVWNFHKISRLSPKILKTETVQNTMSSQGKLFKNKNGTLNMER